MLGWTIFGALLAAMVSFALYLSLRWGRGARGGSFQRPENETQTTTPQKIWP